MPNDPEYASGGRTLVEVITGLEADGYTGDFQTGTDAVIRCLTCDVATPAARLEVKAMRRIEGASDPADMAYVAGLRCPSCGTAGVAVLRYGPEAPLEDADALAALKPPAA